MINHNSKKVVIILLILMFSTSWATGWVSNQKTDNTNILNDEFDKNELSLKDQANLLSYSYEIIDEYFFINEHDKTTNLNFEKINFDYDKLFITLIYNGKIRGCQSGSANKSLDNRIYLDIKEATYKSILDERFGGKLKDYEAIDVDVVFTFLYNKKLLPFNDLDYLENIIELGVNAIEINKDGKRAYFKESVPISKNYDLEKTLERLCEKIDLDKDAYTEYDTKIYIYTTTTFKGNRQGEIIPLYRYNTLVDDKEISNELIYESLSIGKEWFFNNIDKKTQLLEYKYYPSTDKYSTSNNHVRQIASLWSITELKKFFNTDIFDSMIDNTLDYYLKYSTFVDDYAFLTIDGSSKLAYNAFLILSLVNYPNYPKRDELLTCFSNGILKQQQNDGSYNTYFNSDKNTGVDFYPGEAMLSLMKLNEETRDLKYLESVQNAFYYYKSYWRENKNTAFIPWHTQTYKILYQYTNDLELVDFVFEMNDWLIDNYQIVDSVYPDEIGGFPKDDPRCSTSSYMEGINDAYSLAVQVDNKNHISEYKDSIRIGARFMLQTQYNEKNTFYLENPKKAVGGFKSSLVRNYLRNDYTQHAVMALMKVYNNDIFV